MDKTSNQESPKQIPIEERVTLTKQEKTFYDVSLRQSYIFLTNAGYEIGPDDIKKMEQGLKLVVEATRPLQDETNALGYFTLSFAHNMEVNFKPRHKDFYTPGYTAPYSGANHTKEVPAYVDGNTIKYETGDGKVFDFLIFPIPDTQTEGLKFGAIIGSQEVLFNKPKNEYYYGPMQSISDEDKESVKKAIIKSGIFTVEELDFFMAKSRTE